MDFQSAQNVISELRRLADGGTPNKKTCGITGNISTYLSGSDGFWAFMQDELGTSPEKFVKDTLTEVYQREHSGNTD